MQIKQITKLANGLYEVIVTDGTKETKFTFNEEVLIDNNWYSLKSLTNDELNKMQTLANYSGIYKKVLNFISFKMRTEQEILDYLIKVNCAKEFQTEIINKLKNLNYLNDERYAEMFIDQQFRLNKKGPVWIRQKLTQKGLALALVDTKLKKLINEEAINETVKALITSLEKANKSKPISKLKQSIMQNLLTKGYNYQDINYVLSNYSFNRNLLDERSLIDKEMAKYKKRYEKKYSGRDLKERVLKALLGKGYSYQLCEEIWQNEA